jgi:predicted thioesterase
MGIISYIIEQKGEGGVDHDGADKISEGTHERFVIDFGKFNEKVEIKARSARADRERNK